MKIYVIEGSTGEYSDHREWLVRAFRTEEAAKAEVVRLSEMSGLYETRRQAEEDFYVIEYDHDKHAAWLDANVPGFREADPGFAHDYTGTNYTYHYVELEDR